MKPLGRTARNLLLGAHILCAALWMGGVAALLVISLVGARPHHDEALSLMRLALRWIDWVIIIPACLGSLLTGLLFSWLTTWGFFKHTWLVIKWALTVAMILFGIFFLGPWVDRTAALAAERGILSLGDPVYSVTATRILAAGAVQLTLLLFMLFLSTLKPFGKRG